jgi:hypothetical protein
MDDQASEICKIAVPLKHVAFVPTNLKTFEEAKQAAKGFDIDNCFNDSQFG